MKYPEAVLETPTEKTGRETPLTGRIRPLPVRGIARIGKGSDIWHKPAFSAATALVIPQLVLLVIGRLDLALYTSAGSMCALYAHSLPYAARARTLVWVIVGMLAGFGVALTTASLTDSGPVLVLGAALVAAAHKMLCDATRIGPPGNLIFTFIAASGFFLPQRLSDVPFHMALALAGAAVAWLVCMAPGLVRPHGPERIATARARGAAAAAVNAAWHTLFLVSGGSTASAVSRAGLERLLVRAEAAPARGSTGPAAEAEAGRLAVWAHDLRTNRPLPRVALTAEQSDELAGIAVERAAHRPRGVRAVLRRLRPGSPLLPIGLRVTIGCSLAGWASLGLGVGHPYWAVVMAASVFQANTVLSWQRAAQRVLGSFPGVLVFALVLPLARTGDLALILLIFLAQIGAEALIPRNYWIGTICVTTLALLLTEFGEKAPAGELIGDRLIDSLLGAVLGVLVCLVVANRPTGGRVERALRQVERLRAEALRPVAAAPEARREAERVVGRLTAALVELRDAAETASGEWWLRALPQERVATAEREGHRALADLRRRLDAPRVPEPTDRQN
ncbi:FUSC family protein [Streptomyces megasporus]|uniref:FUSC family protein n=1 Tax=Streptomyces megasporus TaxID=44060 RepID=UPI000690FC09|nr:FUSC family protein [Streptomyces megasporus]